MTTQERLERLEREVFGVESATSYPETVSIRRDIETKYELIRFLLAYAGIKVTWCNTKLSKISPRDGGHYECTAPTKKRWWQF